MTPADDPKARMVKALLTAADCLREAGLRSARSFGTPSPDPDITAIAILAAELFRADTAPPPARRTTRRPRQQPEAVPAPEASSPTPSPFEP